MVKEKILVLILLAINVFSPLYAQSILVQRSEYEKVNDQIYDINHAKEGQGEYLIKSGNDHNYYNVNKATGIISVELPINDVIGQVHSDTLFIDILGNEITIIIADGYDFFISNHPNYRVLDKHNQTYFTKGNKYTAFNNLWRKGNAIPGQDFRMATLINENMPDSTVFIWDVPSKATEFNGGSIWSYINLLWGERKQIREDLEGFPIRVNDISSLLIDFDFEKLFGTEGYKIALNHFFTNDSTIAPFSSNVGDFFFVFDQLGTWLPSYPIDLGDITINEKTFARLYQNNGSYELRRVVVKSNERLLKGQLNLKSIYQPFIDKGYIDPNQYIPNIQIGVEVTDGFGAIRINKWDIDLKKTVTVIENKNKTE